MSSVAHCAVVRNPFSTAVAHAKIPDGSVSLSTSCRYSISTTVTESIGSIDILLTPSIWAPIHTRTGVMATDLTSDTGTPTMCTRTLRDYFIQSPSRDAQYAFDATNLDTVNITHSNSVPNQYRIVSQGLRISLINNTSDNDGWFEAIRLTPSYTPHDFQLKKKNDRYAIVPNSRFFENTILGEMNNPAGITGNTPDWSMNPSYIAGRLRDLHKHNFVLCRQENSDFVEIPTKCNVTVTKREDATSTLAPVGDNDDFAYEPAKELPAFAATDPEVPIKAMYNAFISSAVDGNKWWIDNQMDSILIRIRAKPVDAATANDRLYLHFHLNQHVEECYDERSDLYRFMTKCPANKALYDATLIAMKQDIKPSIIRSPTLPVSTPTYNRYRKRRYRR